MGRRRRPRSLLLPLRPEPRQALGVNEGQPRVASPCVGLAPPPRGLGGRPSRPLLDHGARGGFWPLHTSSGAVPPRSAAAAENYGFLALSSPAVAQVEHGVGSHPSTRRTTLQRLHRHDGRVMCPTMLAIIVPCSPLAPTHPLRRRQAADVAIRGIQGHSWPALRSAGDMASGYDHIVVGAGFGGSCACGRAYPGPMSYRGRRRW